MKGEMYSCDKRMGEWAQLFTSIYLPCMWAVCRQGYNTTVIELYSMDGSNSLYICTCGHVVCAWWVCGRSHLHGCPHPVPWSTPLPLLYITHSHQTGFHFFSISIGIFDVHLSILSPMLGSCMGHTRVMLGSCMGHASPIDGSIDKDKDKDT